MSERGLGRPPAVAVRHRGCAPGRDRPDHRSFVADLHDAVDDQTVGWTEDTPSRQAQRTFEDALGTSVTALADCLGEVKAAVASYRESAHDTEVENVAIVG